MKRLMIVMFVASVMASAGCSLSGRGFRTATRPEGATTRAAVDGVEYVGELLEVRSDAVLLLTSLRIEPIRSGRRESAERLVRLLPFAALRQIQVEAPRIPAGGPQAGNWDSDVRARVSLLSRFPQGLTPELLQRLLTLRGQTAVAGVKPGVEGVKQ
jgi:hypothetical protein